MTVTVCTEQEGIEMSRSQMVIDAMPTSYILVMIKHVEKLSALKGVTSMCNVQEQQVLTVSFSWCLAYASGWH